MRRGQQEGHELDKILFFSHRTVLYLRSSLWWGSVKVIKKSKEGTEEVRVAAIEGMLKEAHDLFVMFFGSIRRLLRQHPVGDLARSCLHTFFPDYFAEFMVGKKLRLPTIREGLSERGTVEPVTLDRDTLLQTLSLVGPLESWFGGGTACHTMVLFHNYLVWSTLSAVNPKSGTCSVMEQR